MIFSSDIKSSENRAKILTSKLPGTTVTPLNGSLSNKDRDEAMQDAAEPGNVTCATLIAGRGFDPRVAPDVNAKGGLVIILTFIPENERELEQILNRTARYNQKGIAYIILSQEEITSKEKKYDIKLADMNNDVKAFMKYIFEKNNARLLNKRTLEQNNFVFEFQKYFKEDIRVHSESAKQYIKTKIEKANSQIRKDYAKNPLNRHRMILEHRIDFIKNMLDKLKTDLEADEISYLQGELERFTKEIQALPNSLEVPMVQANVPDSKDAKVENNAASSLADGMEDREVDMNDPYIARHFVNVDMATGEIENNAPEPQDPTTANSDSGEIENNAPESQDPTTANSDSNDVKAENTTSSSSSQAAPSPASANPSSSGSKRVEADSKPTETSKKSTKRKEQPEEQKQANSRTKRSRPGKSSDLSNVTITISMEDEKPNKSKGTKRPADTSASSSSSNRDSVLKPEKNKRPKSDKPTALSDNQTTPMEDEEPSNKETLKSKGTKRSAEASTSSAPSPAPQLSNRDSALHEHGTFRKKARVESAPPSSNQSPPRNT